MIAIENVNSFVTGVQPDAVADDSSGAGTQDGFEFIAAFIDNSIIGPQQAFMDYAGLTPNGVTEAAGASQMIEAMKKGFGIGPGWVSRRDIFNSPAVHGDRSILLSGQTVLASVYGDLVDAAWIGGNTAAQVAAIAAGVPYYRCSDPAGLVGDAAGAYLQLPKNPSPTFLKQYLGGVDFTVTGGPGFVLQRCVLTPYKTVDGTWRIIGNLDWDFTSATAPAPSISGISFKAGGGQSVNVYSNINDWLRGVTSPGSGNFIIRLGVASTSAAISFDVELDSKPTWADDFEPQYAITY